MIKTKSAGKPASLAILGLLAALPALAATSDGQFAVRGIGSENCKSLAEALTGTDGKAVRLRLSDWVSGWLSHANRSTDGQFDLSPIQDQVAIAQILGALCQKNPDALAETVLASMMDGLKAPDGSVSSDITKIEGASGKLLLRSADLKRAQLKLVELGMLEEKMADGTFGPASEKAFTAYQTSKGLKETGLPDAITIYTLLRADK